MSGQYWWPLIDPIGSYQYFSEGSVSDHQPFECIVHRGSCPWGQCRVIVVQINGCIHPFFSYIRFQSKPINMKRKSSFLIGTLFMLIISGCTEEQQLENCLVGTWRNNTAYCQTTAEYTFSSNGTAIGRINDCGFCTDGAAWYSTANFDYVVSDAGLTITFTG